MKWILLFVFTLLFGQSSIGQLPISLSQDIHCKVQDYDNHVPLWGATVLNGKEIVTTDINGGFSFIAQIGDTLVIQYVGYQPKNYVVPDYHGSCTIRLNPLFLLDEDIVISANKYDQSHSFATLELDDNAILNPNTIQDVYNRVPGLYMHSGAINTNRLTIRGIGSRSPFSTTKIKAYVNDIPITSGIGESNLEDINLSFLDNVSIYKGPSRPVFGASLGGVIRYSSNKRLEKESFGEIMTGIGSFGMRKADATAVATGKDVYIGMNYNILSQEGYRDNNNLDRQIFTLFSEYYREKHSLSFFLQNTSLHAQIPSALNLDDYTNSPKSAAFNWKSVEGNELNKRTYGGLSYQYVTSRFKSSNTLFGSYYSNNERRPFNTIALNNSTLGVRSTNAITYNNERGIIQAGFELFTEQENWETFETKGLQIGDQLSENVEFRRYANLFVENKYRLSRWSLRTGLNLNLTEYNYQDNYTLDSIDLSGEFKYKPILSPFISIDYRWLKNLLYGSISHGFSLPTVEETLTPTGLINPDISPETGWNFEVGMRRKVRQIDFDVSLYYMLVSNLLISERISEDQTIGINAGITGHPGLEINLQKELRWKKAKGNFYINYQFSPHKFIDFVNNEVDYSNAYLPGNPISKTQFGLEAEYGRWKGRINHMYVSSMFADDGNEIKVPGYWLANVDLQVSIYKSKFWTVSMNGSINNIFNSTYSSMIAVNPRSFGGNAPRYLYPGLPRNFSANIIVKYKLNKSSL